MASADTQVCRSPASSGAPVRSTMAAIRGSIRVRGRPLPPRTQEYGYRAGLAVLATLFVFATWNDLTQIGVFRWVAGLIG